MTDATAFCVPCDSCGAEIEGASVWYGLRKYHPWCWDTAQALHRPSFDAAVRQLVQDAQEPPAPAVRAMD